MGRGQLEPARDLCKTPEVSPVMWKMFGLVVVAVVASGCSHSDPFDASTEEIRRFAPLRTSEVSRLTYNPGFDGYPTIWNDTIIYSRRDESRPDSDICLAYLPVSGGELLRQVCPQPDGTREYWLAPAVSPDGTRIAYLRERTDTARSRSLPGLRELVIARYDDPPDVELAIPIFPHHLFEAFQGRGMPPLRANYVRDTHWIDDHVIRAVIGDQSPRNLRPVEWELYTKFTPMGVIEFDSHTGTWELLDFDLPPISIATLGGRMFFADGPALNRDEPCSPRCQERELKVLNRDGSVSVLGAPPERYIRTIIVTGDGQIWTMTGSRAPHPGRRAWYLGTEGITYRQLLPPGGRSQLEQYLTIMGTSDPTTQIALILSQNRRSADLWRLKTNR